MGSKTMIPGVAGATVLAGAARAAEPARSFTPAERARHYADCWSLYNHVQRPIPARIATDKPVAAGEVLIARDDQTERNHLDALKRMNLCGTRPTRRPPICTPSARSSTTPARQRT
jgi:hypothetical protein